MTFLFVRSRTQPSNIRTFHRVSPADIQNEISAWQKLGCSVSVVDDEKVEAVDLFEARNKPQ